jgi:hypothetical protein
MNKKPFDWFAFRNETAARLCATMRASERYKYDSYSTIVKEAVEIADELTFQLMGSNHILQVIEEYGQKKKSRG